MENSISNLVDERQEELLQLLADLVSFPTISPPARNTAGVQLYIQEFLKQEKFDTASWDVFPGDPNVVGIKRQMELCLTAYSLMVILMLRKLGMKQNGLSLSLN